MVKLYKFHYVVKHITYIVFPGKLGEAMPTIHSYRLRTVAIIYTHIG